MARGGQGLGCYLDGLEEGWCNLQKRVVFFIPGFKIIFLSHRHVHLINFFGFNECNFYC